MKTTVLFRSALLAAALGAALSAQAVVITLITQGEYNLESNFANYSESVVYQDTMGLSALSTLEMSFNISSIPFVGNATFSDGGANSLTLAVTFFPTTSNPPYNAGTGTWTYVSGTGTYAGFSTANSFGSFSQTIDTNNQTSGNVFKGELNPVPEPASMAALGLGAAAMLRRRKKA